MRDHALCKIGVDLYLLLSHRHVNQNNLRDRQRSAVQDDSLDQLRCITASSSNYHKLHKIVPPSFFFTFLLHRFFLLL